MVGGYYGKGKRTNVYGALLLACFDEDTEQWQVSRACFLINHPHSLKSQLRTDGYEDRYGILGTAAY